MTDHLPECCVPWPDGSRLDQCICDRLRACEQRMRDLWLDGNAVGRRSGYAAGLDAARDAVAEVEHIGFYAEEVRDAALAAIDALRGES